MPTSPSASFKPWHALASAATGAAATCLLFGFIGAPHTNGLNLLCAVISVPAAAVLLFKLTRTPRSVSHAWVELTQPHPSGKAEALLDKTGRIAGVGGWEVDLITGEVIWSLHTFELHGAPLDFVPTLETGLSFYDEPSRPIIAAAVETACRTGRGWDLELSIIRFDKRRVWVRTVGGVEMKEGKAVGLVGTFQDVTARVAERVALSEANERLTLATDSGRIGIFEWDLVNNVLRCDRWMHRLHGIERTDNRADASANIQYDPLDWRQHLHSEDHERVISAMQDAIAGNTDYDTEFRILWPDGSIRNIRAAGQVTRDAHGKPLRMIGANWDVTEARRLTAELAQQNELLRVTLHSIGDGVITTDAQGNVVWLNSVAERMTGWTSEEALARPIASIFNIVNYVTRRPVENPIMTCIATGVAGKLAPDTILLSRDGARFGIDDSAAPIRGEQGELLGAVLVFHDVTEQRRLFYETTRMAKVELKLKDDFLSRVSHELRSPLTSIYSFTSIIADDLAGNTTSQQQEYLQIVLKNVDQLQSMIEDLLTVTQANEGKLSIDLKPIQLSECVTDALHTIQGPASSKQIALRSNCEKSLPLALADPTRILQILIILLDNAVKFTPEGGLIGVKASQTDGGFLLVQVSDTGRGIPPEKRARVFEHLYQVPGPEHSENAQSDTSRAGRNGLGLGLHIAHDLVVRQGGQIWITGELGNGSTFSFTLPIHRETPSFEPQADLAQTTELPALTTAQVS
ncbi:PAS domain S-box-containing protein [Granulicella aggregans]|uniref:histidine kinase n=1 Tax=Granulicella aggregans TaxID=474949 RepID=A0A7W7ZHI3_9BACT|nr:PAS domain-containing protein [Granulicella aggregans]MBB5059978.1 PAS domain S-box-containing protein [Granulicella aggregans]